MHQYHPVMYCDESRILLSSSTSPLLQSCFCETAEDVNCVDKSKNSSLHYAAAYGRQELVCVVLSLSGQCSQSVVNAQASNM